MYDFDEMLWVLQVTWGSQIILKPQSLIPSTAVVFFIDVDNLQSPDS